MKRTQGHSGQSSDQDATTPAGEKRHYQPPRILSCERLEAIAAVCPPGSFPPLPTGKDVAGGGCVQPGS